MIAAVGWPDVAIALIAGLPGILAAYAALSVRKAVTTPSGTAIGTQVESAHHVALGNNYRLRTITGELGADAPSKAVAEEAQVESLDNGHEEGAG